MLTFPHVLITIVACAAPGDADVRPALRAMLTEGWEIGAFHKAWKQVETLGESRQSDAAALAIAIIEMRHNQFDEANKVLSGLAARSQDPVVFAALAWTEAAKGQHIDALQTLERAARGVSKKPSLQAELVFRAAGSYFGYLECQDVDKEIRAQYRLTRGRVLALASEEQQTMMARLQAGVEQRMGKLPGEHEELPTDPAALEAARSKAVAELDRKLASLTGDYQKQAKQAALLAEQVKGLQVERNKHLDNPNGQAYRELNQAMTLRAAQQRETEEKAAQLAESARELTIYRKSVVRRFDEQLEKAKIVTTPKAPPSDLRDRPAYEPLTKACQFPLDLARQAVLRSILSAEDAKAVNREFRVWTDRQGTMMFVAQLLRVDVDRVVFRNPLGKEASIPLATLSHADQDYIDSTSAPPPLDLTSVEPKPGLPTDPKPPMPAGVLDVTPSATAVSLFNVKITSATYGVGDMKKDVTEIIRAHLAKDPFAPVQCDDHALGDPAFGKHKFVEVAFEVDGKADKLVVGHEQTGTLPSLPDEGIPLASASKDLRILAARFGAGLKWQDVTVMVQQRVTHPGAPIHWTGLWWHDLRFGGNKYLTVWFDYQGKRYVRWFTEGDTKPLLAGLPAPAASGGNFIAITKQGEWNHEAKKPARLASNDRAFGVLVEAAGKFAGPGEEVRLSLDGETWVLDGRTAQPLLARAQSITTPLREKFLRKPEEYLWKAGSKPIKMLHSSEGFCVLSSIGGHFGGDGEAAFVTIDPKDGFWYLDGLAANGSITARAIAYRLKPNSGIQLRCLEYRLREGSLKILDKDRGFCFLSGMTGHFQGYDQTARLRLTSEGHWQLDAQRCGARAFAVIVD